MSQDKRRRTVLGVCLFSAPAAALIAGLTVVAGEVSHTREDLLREEAKIAVELLRGAPDSVALRQVFGDRWYLDDETSASLGDVTIRRFATGLVAAATVFGADSWYEIGTLRLGERESASSSIPLFTLILSGVSLIALATISLAVVRRSTEPVFRRYAYTPLASVALCAPLISALVWSDAKLEQASLTRLETGVQAVARTQDLDSVLALPGGVARVSGAQFLVRNSDGTVEFSVLPTAATNDLGRAEVRGVERIKADRVDYLVTDFERVRLAILPYDQTHSPLPRVILFAFVGMLLASLSVFLTSLVDRPRVFKRNVVAWSFLAPAAVHLALFTLGPLAIAAWLSLHRWSLIDVARPFVGLSNYVRLVGDTSFWNAIKNTAVFALHVPVSMSVALAIALIIQRRVRGMVLLRAMLFLPTITSLVAVAMVWQWMLHDEYGLFNWLLSLVGLGPVAWISSPSTALLSIMIMATWMVVGYQMILFQAGLAAIPTDLYDAARIDGASPLRRFFHVTLPGLRHTLFFVLVTSVIGSFQVFGAVYVMTEGGPLHSTDVAVYHIYEEAWEFLRFGDAAAMSWVLFAIIFIVTWLQFRTLERKAEV